VYAWTYDQYVLDQPDSDLIQLNLQADYHTNIEQYGEWQAYLREHQPPTLVVWGENDPIFGAEGARAFEDDLDTVDVRLFDTGHFALEENCEEIATLTREFLGDHVASD
jgi:pimeloyl-ACP methyl ester carboxylesterase